MSPQGEGGGATVSAEGRGRAGMYASAVWEGTEGRQGRAAGDSQMLNKEVQFCSPLYCWQGRAAGDSPHRDEKAGGRLGLTRTGYGLHHHHSFDPHSPPVCRCGSRAGRG